MSKKIGEVINYNIDMGSLSDHVEPGSALLESPSDPIGSTEVKAKKKRKKAPVTPAHAASEGYHEEMQKASFGQRFPGDDGLIRVKELGVNRHPDLNQSDSSFNGVRARLETCRGNVYDLHLDQDVPGGFSHRGTADLTLYDARGNAGLVYGLRNAVGHDPNRPDYHQAPTGSGTNGGHDHSNPVGASSYAVSNKQETKLEMVKRTQKRLD